MKPKLYSVFSCLFFILILNSTALQAQLVNPDFLDGELYLKVENSSSVELSPVPAIPALTTILNTYGVDTIYRSFANPDTSIQRIYRLTFTDTANTGVLISALAALPFIEYAEGVPLMRTQGTVAYTPNDLAGSSYHLNLIRATEAWDLARGDNSIVVAIVDNAVLTTHEDLQPVLWTNPADPANGLDDDFNGYTDDVNGADVADGDGDPNPPANPDPSWDHGSHVASDAVAATDNGLGISSIGFGVSLMSVKASANATGGNTLERAYEGVDYAVNAGADIINMSFGSEANTITGGLIVDMARNNGVLLIAAAGNDNSTTPFYPASYSSVLAVGSTNANDEKSGFSNYGNQIDVMAPGTGIKGALASSTTAYGTLSGTSMASPIVAGLAGLLLSDQPNLTPQQLRDQIVMSAENIDAQNPNFVGQIGSGRIDAFTTLGGTVSLEPALDGSALRLFPNPAQDRIYLIGEPVDPEVEAHITDLNGRTLIQTNLRALQDGVDIADLPVGIYLLHQSGSDLHSTHKFIVR